MRDDVPRPVWSDKAPDVQAVAEHLERAAREAPSALAFEPVRLPAGADRRVLHQAALARARRQLAASHAEKDRILAQEVRAVDDLVRSANLLVERLREWYALHSPEATRLEPDPERLAHLVAEHGERGAVLAALDQAALAETSLGTELGAADVAVLSGFAAALSAIHQSWHALERRVQELMEEVAPNVAAVAGPVLGARLIAQAGSLQRLASWPAGTVQLLGAETALFRHIKEGTRSPKHGFLFQHPLIHQAPPWQRGPIARALALACSLAAKADAFTRNDLRPQLKEDLDAALARIRHARPRPPARPMGRGPPRGPGAGRGPPFRGPSRGPPRGPSGPPREGDRDGGRPAPRPWAPRPAGPASSPAPRPGPPGPRADGDGGGWRPRPPPGGAGGGGGAGTGWRRDGEGRGSAGGPPGKGPPSRGPPRDRDGPRRGDDRGGWGPPKKRKGPGAFRGKGGPAPPPGRGDA